MVGHIDAACYSRFRPVSRRRLIGINRLRRRHCNAKPPYRRRFFFSPTKKKKNIFFLQLFQRLMINFFKYLHHEAESHVAVALEADKPTDRQARDA